MSVTWSETFAAYLADNGLEQQAVAFDLKIAPSKVHYWAHGARPHDPEMRARVEVWSKGRVRADLPRAVKRARHARPRSRADSRKTA